MIKTGLTRTLIYEFIDEHKLPDIQSIVDRSQDLYKFLKQHESNPLTSACNYDTFYREMISGAQIAQVKSQFQFYRG